MMVGGLLWAARHWREPRYTLLLITAVILSPTFLFSGNAPNFDNYTPMLPLLTLFFGVGVVALRDNLPQLGQRGLEIGLLGLLAFNGGWTAEDLDAWRDHPDVQLAHHHQIGQLAAHIDRTANERPTVICGWRADQSPTATRLNDAQFIAILLNRDSQENIRYADCRQALVLTNGGALQQVVMPNPNLIANLPPEIERWLMMGDTLNAENLPPDSVLVMDVEAALADWGGQLTTGQRVAYAPEAETEGRERFNTPVSFGGNLTLLGYVMDSNAYTARKTRSLSHHIGAYKGEFRRIYACLRTFFSDPSASPPANTDVILINPRYLRDRDVVIQVTGVPLPASLPNGDYYVSIGGYQDTSNIRLDVLDDGQTRGTRLFLDSIVVETAAE